jgi:hypothetical protein
MTWIKPTSDEGFPLFLRLLVICPLEVSVAKVM